MSLYYIIYTNRTKCNKNFSINEKSKHLIHFLLHVIFCAGKRYFECEISQKFEYSYFELSFLMTPHNQFKAFVCLNFSRNLLFGRKTLISND